jgi:hypothetical protein
MLLARARSTTHIRTRGQPCEVWLVSCRIVNEAGQAMSPFGTEGKREGLLSRCWFRFAISMLRSRSIRIW